MGDAKGEDLYQAFRSLNSPKATPVTSIILSQYMSPGDAGISILTWHGRYHDHQGGSPRSRPFHCTSVGLTPAIIPNVDYSSA